MPTEFVKQNNTKSQLTGDELYDYFMCIYLSLSTAYLTVFLKAYSIK